MKQLSIMIKPASAACNLRCKYCFYADISKQRQTSFFGVMSRETTEKMLINVRRELEPGDLVQFAFQGGEPTLAGLNYFEEFTATVESWGSEIRVSYALQTNATMLNEQWCRFLRKYRFLVGVSLDILPESHDAVRVDVQGAGTYHQVYRSIRLLEKYGVEYNVLCTLTNQIARHPTQVWNRICQANLRYVQFTPCLDELNRPGESVYALTPKRFASFYTQLFGYWLEDYRKGKYRSIKLFDDVVNLLAFGIPTSCGINGYCGLQTVVEADGSVYPCDFYCLDSYRMGNITEQTVSQLRKTPQQAAFLQRPRERPDLCGQCPYRTFCNGNCERMQREICCTKDGKFCGYREFLSTCGAALQEIAAYERAAQKNTGANKNSAG